MKIILNFYNQLVNDSLYSNSIYLILSTVVTAVLGFFFWILNARIFTPDEVGIGTTLISAMNLLSSFCILGLGASMVKYLPSSNKKSEIINTALTLITIASIVSALIYIGFINNFSPKLLFLKENLFFFVTFILFVVFSSLNTISQHIFVAYRASVYVFIKNTLLSLLKLISPLLFISLGSYGVFMSIGVPTGVAFLTTLFFLATRFDHKTFPTINTEIVKKLSRFSAANYIMGLVSTVPSYILPILITNNMDPKFSAYFYMDMMIASFLYIIPQAVSQSLFAEGSYDKDEIGRLLKKANKIILLLLIPALAGVFLFGEFVLHTFGKEYSSEGIVLLHLLSATTIFISINSLGTTLLYIKHKIKLAVVINFISTVAIIILSFVFLKWGLYGIGLAWLIGNGIISLYFLPLLARKRVV